MKPILTVTRVSKSFGGLSALKEISLAAHPGQIVGIIGPNGAGKTTLFNCLAGLYSPTRGQIRFGDRPVAPEFSGAKAKHIRRCAVLFMALGLVWLPLFWSFFLPDAFFKVELVLLGIFILAMRFYLVRGLMRFQIWAWGFMVLFLLSDLFFAVWWLIRLSPSVHMVGTHFALRCLAWPWAIGAGVFSIYLMIQLLTPQVRQMYGFRQSPDAICRMGMARTFQNIRLFFNLSVLDNVKIGCHARMKVGVWGALFKTRAQQEEEAGTEKEAMECLRFVGLEKRAFNLAGALAYGEQRRLEIARAMASRPKVLLLDEPAAGMNPRESSQLIELILKIREKGITVLIIEHDMRVMMSLADYIYVLDYGSLIAEGIPDEIRNNRQVIEAYLGGGASHAAT
ncbi:MAG: ATP-binding cassette domain-containing protein [Deltaproteobacteria bacterium]|nr:ATP-binding cassette domain-containing protein [Deltaproteobacteria bacterium]